MVDAEDDLGFSKKWNKTDYKIIDSGNNHLKKLDDSAKCINKNEFAKYVADDPEKFSFENFRDIYLLIKRIVEEKEK